MQPSDPTGADLLALERLARRQGTALEVKALIGCWQLQQIWPRGAATPAAFSGTLLRSVGARLEISAGEADGLILCNAVSLGPLALCFHGPGWLTGGRPLLQFRFERLELRLAGRTLLQRPIPSPAPQRLPFFALIARDPSGWLAARGRGGGLALWRLAAP